jgi:hypothetical protein
MPRQHQVLVQQHGKQARAMHDGPSFAELKGKRLGAVERGILLCAGSPAQTNALLLKALSGRRSEQESVRRAARRLESLRLIRVAKVREGTRAHDPRRHDPYFWDGDFRERIDKKRRQAIPRLFCWRTVFGQGLVDAYREELTGRRRIRWKEETYDRLARLASLNPASAASWQTAEADVGRVLEPSPPEIEGVLPPFSDRSSPGELQRWDLSILVAASRNAGAGSKRLFDETLALMESEISLEELRREAPGKPVRPPKNTTSPKAFDDNFDRSNKRLIEEERGRRNLLSDI